MPANKTSSDRQASSARPWALKSALAGLALWGVATTATALDGCQVLLCLAAPNWREIPMCALTLRQLFHDMARGRLFPTCAMAGNGNGSKHAWASAPDFCPPQYTNVELLESGYRYTCSYAGAVTVMVNGSLFTRTWWNFDGSTVTEYSPHAKLTLQQWDPQFDTDYIAWLARQ